ncbi:MAG: class I SAM-dependent methyltransferase [Pseudomonadota bacterium]
MPECRHGLTTFYNQAWSQWDDMARFSPAPRSRRRIILNRMEKLPIESLLDVGCGNGLFLAEVRQRLRIRTLVGVDVSTEIIQANRKIMPEVEFKVLDLNHETLDQRFDAVVCMELIEHCEDPFDAIARLAAMTDRWLFLSVPCGPVFEIDRRVGHHRHFSVDEIDEMLRRQGLKSLLLQRWGFPFFNLYKHLINFWPDRMCQAFLSPKGYGPGQKVISAFLYNLFRLNLYRGGYQLIAMAYKP